MITCTVCGNSGTTANFSSDHECQPRNPSVKTTKRRMHSKPEDYRDLTYDQLVVKLIEANETIIWYIDKVREQRNEIADIRAELLSTRVTANAVQERIGRLAQSLEVYS